jgi:hypothetical protein
MGKLYGKMLLGSPSRRRKNIGQIFKAWLSVPEKRLEGWASSQDYLTETFGTRTGDRHFLTFFLVVFSTQVCIMKLTLLMAGDGAWRKLNPLLFQ